MGFREKGDREWEYESWSLLGLCEIGRDLSGGFEVKIEGNEQRHVSAIKRDLKVEADAADMLEREVERGGEGWKRRGVEGVRRG